MRSSNKGSGLVIEQSRRLHFRPWLVPSVLRCPVPSIMSLCGAEPRAVETRSAPPTMGLEQLPGDGGRGEVARLVNDGLDSASIRPTSGSGAGALSHLCSGGARWPRSMGAPHRADISRVGDICDAAPTESSDPRYTAPPDPGPAAVVGEAVSAKG